MNFFVAANLFENPWVLLIIVVVGTLSSWLMKRRQSKESDGRPEDDERSPSTSQGRADRELDIEEVLRRILGGEPPPRAPLPPPIPAVLRDGQSSEDRSDEKQFALERGWADEDEASPPAATQQVEQALEARRQHAAQAQASVIRIEASERKEKAARRFEQLNEQGKHPAVASTAHEHGSRTGAQAVALVRDARTVRHAFIASLVFGPPKAFETSSL